MIGSLLHSRTMLCRLSPTQSTILRISVCTIEAGLPVRSVFALSVCVGASNAVLQLISIHIMRICMYLSDLLLRAGRLYIGAWLLFYMIVSPLRLLICIMNPTSVYSCHTHLHKSCH